MNTPESLIPFDLALLHSEFYDLVLKISGNPLEVVDWAAHDPANPVEGSRVITRTGRGHLFHREDGRWVENGPVVLFHRRRKADTDPIDPSPGNVAKLRRSQVGEGWRIPAHSEPIHARAERWRVGLRVWEPSINAGHGKPYSVGITYRVPIVAPAPPKPKTKRVELTAADIPLGAWIRLDGKHKRVLVTGVDEQRELIGIPAYWSLASFYEQYPDATISIDGGDTWRPFAKEVPCE